MVESAFDAPPPPPPKGGQSGGRKDATRDTGDGGAPPSGSHTRLIAAGGGVGAVITGGALWSWSPLAAVVGLGAAGTVAAGATVAARRRRARAADPLAGMGRSVRSVARQAARTARQEQRRAAQQARPVDRAARRASGGRGLPLGGGRTGRSATAARSGPVRSRRADRPTPPGKPAGKPPVKAVEKTAARKSAAAPPRRSVRDRLTGRGRTASTGGGPSRARDAKPAPRQSVRAERRAAAADRKARRDGPGPGASPVRDRGSRKGDRTAGRSPKRRPWRPGADKPVRDDKASKTDKATKARTSRRPRGRAADQSEKVGERRSWWVRAFQDQPGPPKPTGPRKDVDVPDSKGAPRRGRRWWAKPAAKPKSEPAPKASKAAKPAKPKPVTKISAEPPPLPPPLPGTERKVDTWLGARALPATQPQFGPPPRPLRRAPVDLTPTFTHPGGDMSTDASTGSTRSRTYTDAADHARASAVKFDDHATTAAGEARQLDGVKGMEQARDDLVAESRRATATADDRRGRAAGLQILADLEGRD